MLYTIHNGPMPTTAAQLPVTTGTAIKTMLQVKTLVRAKVAAWGLSFDGSSAAVPIKCELLTTGTVFGTVTASAEADISKDDYGEAAVSAVLFTLGTSATGYTCTSEGSITVVRMLDAQLVAPTNQYIREFPLGREKHLAAGDALRIRVTAPVAVNAYCWISLDI